MQVGITGTQAGATPEQLGELKYQLEDIARTEVVLGEGKDFGTWLGFITLHHGDCVGADYQAAELVKRNSGITVSHPPVDGRKRGYHRSTEILKPKPYLERNEDIVDMSAVLIALPRMAEKEARRSGTWATVRYAVRRRKPVIIIYPSGTVERR